MAVPPPPPPPGPNWSWALPPPLRLCSHYNVVLTQHGRLDGIVIDQSWIFTSLQGDSSSSPYLFISAAVRIPGQTSLRYPKNLSDMWCSTRAEINVLMCEQTRWTNRTPNVACLRTTFAVFIRLSSKFAGWLNFVFQTVVCFFCFSILTVFGGKMTSQDWQKNLNFN